MDGCERRAEISTSISVIAVKAIKSSIIIVHWIASHSSSYHIGMKLNSLVKEL
jgi:hypothetical protein